jgi:hypothetical protein
VAVDCAYLITDAVSALHNSVLWTQPAAKKVDRKLGVTWDKSKRALDGINQHQDRGRCT